MAEHDEHSSFIKTPQQLITVVVLAFVIPIFGIVMLVHLVVNKPKADPAALAPAAVSARIAPAGKVEFGAPPAPPGARGGEEIVKAVCIACHGKPGVPGAPKIGENAEWGPLIRAGLPKMLAVAIKGEKAMPPRGGAPDLTDDELARAIVYMANQSGGSLKEPAAPAAKPAAKK